jgi:hypothetical protein
MRKTNVGMLASFSLVSLIALAAQNPTQNPAQNPAQGRGQAAPPTQGERVAFQSPWPTTPMRRPALGAEWVRAHYAKAGSKLT